MFSGHVHPIQQGRVLPSSNYLQFEPSGEADCGYILRSRAQPKPGIVEMAKACSVSPAMVTVYHQDWFHRFRRDESYPRVDILSSDGRFWRREIGDSAAAIVESPRPCILGLQDTVATLDTSELIRAAKAILNARPLFFAPREVSSSGVIMLYQQKLITWDPRCAALTTL